MRTECLSILTLIFGLSISSFAEEKTTPARKSQEQLEQEFAEMLSGSVLTGQFTVDGKDTPPHAEKYTILEAKKLQGDLWLLNSRMQYGGKDITFPLSIPIKWSGDTPVITLTNFTIPGMGTFSSRVLIHEGRYAGTWQHGEVGGCMFGRVTKPEKSETPPPAK